MKTKHKFERKILKIKLILMMMDMLMNMELEIELESMEFSWTLGCSRE